MSEHACPRAKGATPLNPRKSVKPFAKSDDDVG